MAKESVAKLMQGNPRIPKILKELQGFSVSVLTGANADTKIDLAAIRTEDTVISAILSDGTTLTDITADHSIVDLRASGTLTLGTVVANNTATVNGRVFTFKATPTGVQEVALGADADAAAANLAAAINAVEGNTVTASAASNVVTVKANAEGTGGNAIAIVGGSNVTASGATLAGGSATGGVKFSSSTATKQVLLFWFNKR